MANTWILIANGRRARLFQRDPRTAGFDEAADFIDPHAAKLTLSGNRHATAKGHGRTAHGGTQFEPKTPSSEKYRHHFAQQLAEYINQGVAEHRCDQVALIASGSMLGALKPLLSIAAASKLRCSVVSDLTRYQGQALQSRILEAVGPLR